MAPAIVAEAATFMVSTVPVNEPVDCPNGAATKLIVDFDPSQRIATSHRAAGDNGRIVTKRGAVVMYIPSYYC